MEKNDLGIKIKALRTSSGMTQKELSKELSVASSTISNWENGYRLPSVTELRRLATFFHVSLAHFELYDTTDNEGILVESDTTMQVVEYKPLGIEAGKNSPWCYFAGVTLVFASNFIPFLTSFGFLTIGILLVLCVFLVDLSKRYRRMKVSHKKILTSINDHVFYVHHDDEDEVIRKKKKARLMAFFGLILSIAYTGNVLLIMRYLDHQIASMISALFLVVLIVIAFFSYQMTASNHHFTKRIDYHKAIKSLGNPFFPSYLILSVLSLLVFSILVNYRRNVFVFDAGLSILSLVALSNSIIAYVLYAFYHRFICRYFLYATNSQGKMRILK